MVNCRVRRYKEIEEGHHELKILQVVMPRQDQGEESKGRLVLLQRLKGGAVSGKALR